MQLFHLLFLNFPFAYTMSSGGRNMIGGIAAEECPSPMAGHVSALWASVIYCIAHNTPGALCPVHHLHSFCPALETRCNTVSWKGNRESY
ncbi:uncharacterized [Tachysurus ichikawai]